LSVEAFHRIGGVDKAPNLPLLLLRFDQLPLKAGKSLGYFPSTLKKHLECPLQPARTRRY